MRSLAAGIALAGIAAPGSAMPVSDFLSKFESLDANGDSNRLASQLGELREEVQNDAAELRAERLAAAAAGKTPAYCPPVDATQPTAEEIVAALEEIPQEHRPFIEVKDALRGYLAYRFPC
ncbi:MAG TPA: hypothetical protein VGM04_03440 [Sphingomicrobium sp.]|jgi:hypothetical protein